jgi:hypothetical protein
MAARLHHADELEAAVEAYELGERTRGEPRYLEQAHARRLGGAGIRRQLRAANGAGIRYLLDYAAGAGITFTRASEAAAYDPRSGAFYDVSTPWPGANVRRVLADGSVLIEGARTNAASYSHEMNQAGVPGWGGGSTIGQNVEAAPDGLTTADRVTVGGGATAFNDHCRRYHGALAGGIYAASFFAKTGTSGPGLAYMQTIDGTGVGTAYTLSAAWQRCVRHLSNTTAYIELFANGVGQGPAPTGTPGDNIVMWGAQMELGGIYPTSPIRSSGAAATRALEAFSFSSGNWTLYQGRWSISVWPQYSSTECTDNPVILGGLTANDYLQFVGGAGAVWFTIGGVATSRAATWSAFQRLTITVDWNARTITLSGFTTGDGSFAMPVGSWTAAQGLGVGRFGGGNHFNGVISRPWAA